MIGLTTNISASRLPNKRVGGILLHPSSLPGPYGIGTLGNNAYRFVDKLKLSKQKIWQILPLVPTPSDHLPYAGNSVFGGNILLIDPDILIKEDLLTQEDVKPLSTSDEISEHEKILQHRLNLLQIAYERFINNPKYISSDFHHFCELNDFWLQDYAVYLSLKNKYNGKPWYEWPTEFAKVNIESVKAFELEQKNQIRFHKFCQYHFFKQWNSLRDYANTQGIQIIGDVPIYSGMDSVECWLRPELFQFDIYRRPKSVSGVPPDVFSETGQIWGHPLYDWSFMHSTHFSWMIQRIIFNLEMYDYIRLDHFKAYTEYYAIPANATDASKGKWMKAPGEQLLFALKEQLGNLPIIVEDFGETNTLSDQVRNKFDLPGMRSLQFGFDKEGLENNLPHTYNKSMVVYTGTHDNNTTQGWFNSLEAQQRQKALNYLNCTPDTITESMIRATWASVANLAIIPMQDVLGLDSKARMNIPGTSNGNWKWRMQENQFTDKHIQMMKNLSELYHR